MHIAIITSTHALYLSYFYNYLFLFTVFAAIYLLPHLLPVVSSKNKKNLTLKPRCPESSLPVLGPTKALTQSFRGKNRHRGAYYIASKLGDL